MLVYNAAIQSNVISIDLTAPTAPALFAEPTVGEFGTLHVHVHSGPVVGPALSLVVLSQTLAPSTLPGFASLEIGAGFSDVQLDPLVYSNDPVTGVAMANYGPIPAAMLGSFFFFEGLIVDIGAQSLPLADTNVWRADFQ